jgi:flagellar hook-basal body protein
MSAQITNLDVIGNNIANSSTIGFKAGRVTFNEMLTQTLSGATRPVSGGLGGTNPQQIGLGTRVGSIDTLFNQGTFQTTGKKTDLAIQGSGFFILNNGVNNVYSRAGVFGFDSQSVLVNPTTGWRVQGVMADAAGNIGNGPMTDIFIDPDLVIPAQASTLLELMGNLDSSNDSTGTISQSASFLAAAGASDNLVGMSAMGTGSLGLAAGDIIRLNGTAAGLPVGTSTFTVADDSTMQDLVSWLNRSTSSTGQNVSFSLDTSGAIQVQNDSAGDVTGLSLSSGNLAAFNSNFIFEPTIAAGQASQSSELRSYAQAGDLLADLYDANGRPLDIDLNSAASSLTIGGSVGGTPVTDHAMSVNPGSTLGDLMREMQYALGINSNPVTINDTGQLTVAGEVGTDFALSGITVRETGISNPVMENAFSFTQVQAATDAQVFSLATTVYDSLGSEHTVAFDFEKVPGMNEWTWTASMEGGENVLSGGSSSHQFSPLMCLCPRARRREPGSVALASRPSGHAIVCRCRRGPCQRKARSPRSVRLCRRGPLGLLAGLPGRCAGCRCAVDPSDNGCRGRSRRGDSRNPRQNTRTPRAPRAAMSETATVAYQVAVSSFVPRRRLLEDLGCVLPPVGTPDGELLDKQAAANGPSALGRMAVRRIWHRKRAGDCAEAIGGYLALFRDPLMQVEGLHPGERPVTSRAMPPAVRPWGRHVTVGTVGVAGRDRTPPPAVRLGEGAHFANGWSLPVPAVRAVSIRHGRSPRWPHARMGSPVTPRLPPSGRCHVRRPRGTARVLRLG